LENSQNIYQTIKQENSEFLHNIAIVYKKESISYGKLFEFTDIIRYFLLDGNVHRGDKVALKCYDSPECIIISLGILAAGGIIVPVSPAMPESESEKLCRKIEVDFFIDKSTGNPGADSSFCCCGILMELKCFKNTTLPEKKQKYDISALNIAFIRFTSGTTSESKGVMISHEAVIERTDAANQGLGVDRNDSVLWVLSMAYHFVVTILLFLRRGVKLVICHEPVLVSMAQLLRENRITFLYATPVHYRMMIESDAFKPDMLMNINTAISTAMSLNTATASGFRQKFGIVLRQAYGIIEIGLPCIGDASGEFYAGLVGKPLPGYDIKLTYLDGSDAGRILVKGPGMFAGYLKPLRLASAICKDGYFDTGDMGRIEKDGSLVICGRKKQIINFAGMKIFPYEVENVILGCDSVEDVQVFAVEDPQYGEIPKAEIVVKPGLDRNEVIEDIKKNCYTRLSTYKVPKIFEAVDHIEKTLSGKSRLRQEDK